MKIKLVLFILLLFVIGCTSTEKNGAQSDDGAIVIDVNSALKGEGRNFEDMIESVELIPLETTEASVVGELFDFIVTDSNIFLSDSYMESLGLIMFDRNGKFVKRFAHGNGPGEIISVSDIFYGGNNLYVYSDPVRKFYKFTSNGEFVNDKNSSDEQTAFTIKYGDGFLLVCPHWLDMREQKFRVIKTDSNFVKLSEAKLDKNPFTFLTNHLSCIDGVNCLVFRFGDDIVYNYANDSLSLKYRLDYPDFWYDYSTCKDVEKPSYDGGGRKALDRNMDEGKYLFGGKLQNCDDYLIFKMYGKNANIKTVFYNKNTGKTWQLENQDESSVFNLIKTTGTEQLFGHHNTFFGIIIPEDLSGRGKIINPNNLFSAKDIEILKNAKEDDNPIIVIYKLKDNL